MWINKSPKRYRFDVMATWHKVDIGLKQEISIKPVGKLK